LVKIRLRRMGAKKKPFYRVVVADSRAARGGRFIEAIGTYDTTQDPPAIKLETERVEYWLGNGAQPSDVARGLLKAAGFLGGAKPKPEKTTRPKKGKATETPATEAPASETSASEEPAAEAPAEEGPAEAAGEEQSE